VGLGKECKRRKNLNEEKNLKTITTYLFFDLKTQLNINGVNSTDHVASSSTHGNDGNSNSSDLATHLNGFKGNIKEIFAPMEVVMATLTEFYSFIGRQKKSLKKKSLFVKKSLLYEIIYQFMVKLVKRYLI
jgi:hypothetical protein